MKYLLKMKYLVLKIIFLGCDLLLSESYFWFLLDDESGSIYGGDTCVIKNAIKKGRSPDHPCQEIYKFGR